MKKISIILGIVILLTACSNKTVQNELNEIPNQSSSPKVTKIPAPSQASQFDTVKISEANIIRYYLQRSLGQTSQSLLDPTIKTRIFAAYEVLSREDKEGMSELTIKAAVNEMYKQNNEIKVGSKSNNQVNIILQEQGDGVPVVTEHKIIPETSPPSDDTAHSQLLTKLQEDITSQAKQAFSNDQTFSFIAQTFFENLESFTKSNTQNKNGISPVDQYIKTSPYVTEEFRQKVITDKADFICAQNIPAYLSYQEFSGLPGLLIHQFMGVEEGAKRKVLFKQVAGGWKIDSITCEI
jgi:hypothetical protein